MTAFALILFFNVFAATEANAQGILNQILNKMDEHNKALKSLRANVTMVKFNDQLKETDTTEGRAIYVPAKGRDALIRIDWTKPVQESLAVVNKEYIIYRPRLNQAVVGKVDAKASQGKGANNALAFINMSKEQLKANYTVRYLGQENVGSTPTWHLELTPKNATSYKLAELWVDGNGMPIQAKVVENNNDWTTVRLYDLQKNVSVNPKVDIPITPPKGTKIIKG